jgi:AraC family transcriptional regulator
VEQIATLATLATREPKEKQKMEPRIVIKPAFTVVGLPFAGQVSHAPYEGGNENNEIGDVWDRLPARTAEIKNINGPAVGLCFGMPNDREPWYIAGREVERAEDVPDDMMSMTVPAHKYAVFTCTLGTLGETYRYITEEWEPRTGDQHADAPDFEYYDGKLAPNEPENMELSVYWPIK